MTRKMMIVAVLMMAAAGCGKSDSEGGGGSGGSGAGAGAAGAGGGGGDAAMVSGELKGMEKEAADAFVAEIKKHWAKLADGWTSAKEAHIAGSNDHFLAQAKELVVKDVNPLEVSEADKLNGLEWRGSIIMKGTAYREVGDPGPMEHGGAMSWRVKGKWSAWADWTPDWVTVKKIKGKWEVDETMTVVQGTPATEADVVKAGVK